jgi:O-succinylbenzoate synthase
MIYRVGYQYYRRPFKRPLMTHHGVWENREGIIVTLTSPDGQVGFGEIAPLQSFGSESLDQAFAWCQSLGDQFTSRTLQSIPAELPACQFGFESAEAMIAISDRSTVSDSPVRSFCRLLPTGEAAFDAWAPMYQQGDRTFKWKVGVAPIHTELTRFERLIHQLPSDVRLRLDANGGFSVDNAHQWLSLCDCLTQQPPMPTIEFIEQPLPPTEFDLLLQLSQTYQTPIALDESVATLAQLQDCYQRGWRGIVVIKAAIAGYPSRVREFCCTHQLDVVWSSVFETAIARQYIFNHLIPSVDYQSHAPQGVRALGFGTQHYFDDQRHDWTRFTKK